MNPFVLGNVNILLSMHVYCMLGSLHAFMQEPYTIPHSLHCMIFTEDSLSMAGVKCNIKHVKKKKKSAAYEATLSLSNHHHNHLIN